MSLAINWDGLDASILGPACVAGLIVLSTHVPLGKQQAPVGVPTHVFGVQGVPSPIYVPNCLIQDF